MAQWNFTIENGTALREAIESNDIEQAVKYLYKCYQELYNKMSNEDRNYYQFDIEDTMETLKLYDADLDEDNINYYLQEFYDICDDVRAFVAL